MGTYRRDPKIMWRRERRAHDEAHALLAGAEAEAAADLGTMTLVTGGRMVQLNAVGAEIWELLDGTRDQDAVLGELSDRFDAPTEQLAADLEGFLTELAHEGWIHHV